MFYTYILRSKEGKHYIGSTRDIEMRVGFHNNPKYSCWTARYSDWKLVYSESFPTLKEARIREMEIKHMKG